MDSSYDTVVIGAGLSGLAASIRLSLMGQSVCLLEKHSKTGGLNSYFARGKRPFDTGLHALTNYASKKNRSGPLGIIFKQLRLNKENIPLSPQIQSRIIFPQTDLLFTNNPDDLLNEIENKFPRQKDNFHQLISNLPSYEEIAAMPMNPSRTILKKTITDPLLLNMLIFPVFSYGNPWEDDMDYPRFCILFRSIYMEGLARPLGGIRTLLRVLEKKLSDTGGELRLKTKVKKIEKKNGQVTGVSLENGEIINCKRIISSIGLMETQSLLNPLPPSEEKISFVESIINTKNPPGSYGLRDSMIFYNNSPHYNYRRPSGLIDKDQAVFCFSNNFHHNDFDEGVIRINHLANYNQWRQLKKEQYKEKKREIREYSLSLLKKIHPSLPLNICFEDTFTPTTIERYTGHFQGTVYGGLKKSKTGETSIKGLFLCGNDQGTPGIVGAMLSGITMANGHGWEDL